MPSYKLIYFDIKGKAETIRLAFNVAGITFEDQRVEFKDWPALKPKISSGQLPVLEVDGEQLTESTSIARYVASLGSLMGSNKLECAKIDSVQVLVELLFLCAIKHKFAEGPSKCELHKDFVDKKFPDTIKQLERILGDNDYFVGNKLSLADLHFYSVFSNFEEFVGLKWECKSSKLAKLYKRVEDEPKIKAYLSKSKK